VQWSGERWQLDRARPAAQAGIFTMISYDVAIGLDNVAGADLPHEVTATFRSAVSYSWVRCGPPMRTRCCSPGSNTGAIELINHSSPGASRTRSMPRDEPLVLVN
jgi:hypothetical protein